MKRRTFLQSGAVSSVMIVANPVLSNTEENRKSDPADAIAIDSFELEEITVAQLQEGFKTGKYSARSITEKYLSRIKAIDKKTINAVIEINPHAMAIAESLDKERKEKGTRSPVHGIPVLIKDNIDTADKMKTSAGSLALANSIAPKDSFVAE